ncbi:hypothetical protein CF319_g878 [Tilletia indica]|uniref:Uncharacterized protein n=1 Tax=Tilletia indica TaxID=43049 RepID=A0A177TND6_9BASI|nr:hypothetical protein CF319_g878 [Tilletia indica]KAE8229178.1 hypothetical protein CF326_g5858 [Tilletia indica]KAE8246903.1 hypothetical protein A4X13_0g5579 [Tilletia indica]
MTAARNTKYSTHLALTTDIVLGEPTSKDYVHEIDSTIYEIRDGQVDLTTVVWSRTPPEQGIYIVNQFSLSTADKFLLVANDANCMRLLPQSVDGSEMSSMLPPVLAYLNGHGCIMSVDEDGKGGVVGGFSYQGKAYGWRAFKIRVRFGAGPRFATWKMPAPRMLVAFEAIWEGITENDNLIEASICRIATIEPAPQSLVIALGIGSGAVINKAAHLRQLRANAKIAPTASQPTNEEAPSTPEGTTPELAEVAGTMRAPSPPQGPSPCLTTRAAKRKCLE